MVPTVEAFIRLARLRRLKGSGWRISGVWRIVTHMLQASLIQWRMFPQHGSDKACQELSDGCCEVYRGCDVMPALGSLPRLGSLLGSQKPFEMV